MKRWTACVALLALLSSAAVAAEKPKPLRFAPFKDDLFGYQNIVSSADAGAYLTIDFNRQRDVIGRDLVPEKTAQPDRIDLAVTKLQSDQLLEDHGVRVRYVEVGDIEKPAKAAFIFVHGFQGNRFQGVDDQMFGGNFNRLKNLVIKAGGVYLSPGLGNEGDTGTNQVEVVMREFAKNSPGAPIFLACSSNGGKVCWKIAGDPEMAKLLGGVVLLGATSGFSFLDSPVPRQYRIPILIAHGSGDRIISGDASVQLYKTMRSTMPDYPVRLVVFKSGAHGTPMRLIDWRDTLNWMAANDGR